MERPIIVNEIVQGNAINLIESHVEKTRWFKITYYHKGQGKEVTRYGNWDSKCRVWLTKNDDIAVCYLQVDENNEPQMRIRRKDGDTGPELDRHAYVPMHK